MSEKDCVDIGIYEHGSDSKEEAERPGLLKTKRDRR